MLPFVPIGRTFLGGATRAARASAPFSAFHRACAARGVLDANPRFVQVELDVSNKCNIRCRMCYFSRDDYFTGAPTFFDPAQFARLAAEVFPSTQTLALSLGSEPLTSPHFSELLGGLRRWAIPTITFYTNGLLLTPRLSETIVDTGVTQVCLSIDGATRETFESIRRGASFDRFLDNVRGLVRARERYGASNPVLRFSTVMMKRNVHELEDIVQLAAELGVAEVNFFHLVRYDGLDVEGESLMDHQAESNACLTRALARAATLGVRVVGAPRLFGQEAATGACGPFEATPYCRYPFFHVSINAGGHVLACPFSHGVEPFGRITPQTTLADIWFGRKFEELRERILRRDPPEMCHRCSYLASHYPDRAALFATRAIPGRPVSRPPEDGTCADA